VLDTTHAELGFRVRHMMVSWTRGKFDKFEGSLQLDEQDPTRSKVSVSVEVASINTNVKDRDDHLRSADFFDVANHPAMTFASTGIELRDGRMLVSGDLTIRGVTKRVTLDADPLPPAVKDPFGNVKTGTRATAVLKRKEFGLTWNALLEAGGLAVGEDVELTLDVEFTKQA